MDRTTLAKQQAAMASLKYIKPGMVIGLGSGSTAAEMIRLLGKRVAQGLEITGVASSENSARLAKELDIPLSTLEQTPVLDLNIDGADEVDPEFNMIKGGGGALLREKILASSARRNVFIIDPSKQVSKLGAFKLPLEVISFATESVVLQLRQMGLEPILRKNGEATYKTDENNIILDVDITNFSDYPALNTALLAIPGLVETGLFLGYTDTLLIGAQDGIQVIDNQKKR